jgi:hypothetical protein
MHITSKGVYGCSRGSGRASTRCKSCKINWLIIVKSILIFSPKTWQHVVVTYMLARASKECEELSKRIWCIIKFLQSIITNHIFLCTYEIFSSLLFSLLDRQVGRIKRQ